MVWPDREFASKYEDGPKLPTPFDPRNKGKRSLRTEADHIAYETQVKDWIAAEISRCMRLGKALEKRIVHAGLSGMDIEIGEFTLADATEEFLKAAYGLIYDLL